MFVEVGDVSTRELEQQRKWNHDGEMQREMRRFESPEIPHIERTAAPLGVRSLGECEPRTESPALHRTSTSQPLEIF